MNWPVLVTGFEPFGGELQNPSQLLVAELAESPRAVPGLELHTATLPVDIERSGPALDAALAASRPVALLLVGQATGRDQVCLECNAANQVAYGEAVDNGGHRVRDRPIEPDGPDRLTATLPWAQLERQLVRQGLPVRLSEDAGRYLCNFVLYRALHRHPGIPAAFLHLPLLPEQAARRGRDEASLPLDVSRRCLRSLLAALPPLMFRGDVG